MIRLPEVKQYDLSREVPALRSSRPGQSHQVPQLTAMVFDFRQLLRDEAVFGCLEMGALISRVDDTDYLAINHRKISLGNRVTLPRIEIEGDDVGEMHHHPSPFPTSWKDFRFFHNTGLSFMGVVDSDEQFYLLLRNHHSLDSAQGYLYDIPMDIWLRHAYWRIPYQLKKALWQYLGVRTTFNKNNSLRFLAEVSQGRGISIFIGDTTSDTLTHYA